MATRPRGYSFFSLARHALSGHRKCPVAWRKAAPRAGYDVVVSGGGHGLAMAYYLAAEHGITNVAVVDKGWIGGGNTGRNTTIIRSNYLRPESAALYDHAFEAGVLPYRRAEALFDVDVSRSVVRYAYDWLVAAARAFTGPAVA